MTDLPSGTITFLFTDIEGSTLRWEQHGEAMQRALARHDALLRAAITSHDGVVFKTVGDAFYAAFTTATSALGAALTAQRALQSAAWDDSVGPLRVRMALHTGSAEMRDGDYFGPALNRVARLLAAGHGGQILLSRVTQELVRDLLPPVTQLRDLGEHRLKDLIRPEHIFQLLAPDLRADFPPLRTLESRINNLPPQPSPLLGRDQELVELRALLRRPDVRLVTLTGPGGTGKTRLGLQLGADLLDDFTDGVFLIELAPIADPGLVASTIAHTLGVKETGGEPLSAGLQAWLRDKQTLLILDNFEQVAAAAPVVADLLRAAPRLKVVITSRVVLRLYEEREFLVAPLQTPNPRQLPPLERLSQYAAVALFIERAQAVKRDFQVTNENAPAVAEICARLDGLPLAIELAATRTKLLTPQALLARLDNRLKMLTGGARDRSARQQTLRGAIDWSYDLLDAAEQALFARLAVFVGGWALEAAEAICCDSGELDVLDGLQSLVDKSLVRQIDAPEAEPRFMMLETIREYALERLALGGAADELHALHVAYYLDLAEQAEPELLGVDQARWLDRLEIEHNNLRAALAWCRDAPEPEIGLRLAGVLAEFWSARGYYSEARRWLDEMLSQSAPTTGARAKALVASGLMAVRQGDAAAARPRFEQSLALARDLNDRQLQARALHGLGAVAHTLDDYATARALLDESLALSQELGDRHGMGNTLYRLGQVAHLQGNYPLARSLYEQSLALRRALGDKRGIAFALHNLGVVAVEEADYAAARVLFEQNLGLFRELSDKLGISLSLHALALTALLQEDAATAWTLGVEALAHFRELGRTMDIAATLELLGQVAVSQGRYEQASAHLVESLVLRRDTDDLIGVASSVEKLAALAEAQGRSRAAVILCAAARSVRDAIDAPIAPSDRIVYEQVLAAARGSLDESTFAAAWAEGTAMSREQAIASALRG
ncbi:MAG TPA: tetratricopeptide repeat protein [Herpetosiphonaceae bacterium]